MCVQKSWPISYRKRLYRLGQDFLDTQYIFLNATILFRWRRACCSCRPTSRTPPSCPPTWSPSSPTTSRDVTLFMLLIRSLLQLRSRSSTDTWTNHMWIANSYRFPIGWIHLCNKIGQWIVIRYWVVWSITISEMY